MKRILMVVLAVALCLTVVSCASPAPVAPAPEAPAPEAPAPEAPAPEAPAPDSPSTGDIVIAVVPQHLGNPAFLPAKEGAEQAGRDLGITVEWVASVRAEASEQVGVVEGLIERGVDGIAISCNHPDALRDVLKRAVDAGIVVSTYDADSPDSGRAFFAGTENYQAGYVCGEQMIKQVSHMDKDVIRVAQLEGLPGAYDIEARKQGFADAIAGTNIEVVYSGACDDDVDKSIEVIEAYTRANGDNIDAWFMAGGWPYFVNPNATPEVNRWRNADPVNRIVVTMDVFPTTRAFFDEGLIDVAVGQDFYAMGYLSVENLLKLIKGGTIDAPEVEGFGLFIDTGVTIVTADNYDAMIPLE